ncbi:MAG: hypothetical protein QM724_10055 [Flavobacteriales bacterium]
MNELPDLKATVHRACLQVLDERIAAAQASIADTQAASQSDTKSSAGDKHETARAMAQLELEKQTSVLQHLQRMHAQVERLAPSDERTQVGPGVLVRTDSGWFYIAVPLGRIVVGGEEVWAISTEAPIYAALKSTPVGQVAFYSGKAYRILEVR